MTESSMAHEPPHKRIQLAHEQYYQDIADAWNGFQSRFQSMQSEFARAYEKACTSQQSSDFTTARDDYQNAWQNACQEAVTTKDYVEAYRKYINAIKSALAEADLDQLSFGDVNRLGQSLITISQTAMCLPAGAQPALNNPFQSVAPHV